MIRKLFNILIGSVLVGLLRISLGIIFILFLFKPVHAQTVTSPVILSDDRYSVPSYLSSWNTEHLGAWTSERAGGVTTFTGQDFVLMFYLWTANAYAGATVTFSSFTSEEKCNNAGKTAAEKFGGPASKPYWVCVPQ